MIAPITAPVTVAGNAVSVLGDSASADATSSGAVPGPAGTDGTGPTTSGDDSILSGTQLAAPVAAPVTVGGNAVSVLGDSASAGATSGGAIPGSAGTDGTGPATSGADSILGGTQLSLPLVAPVTVGGNAISVIGDSTTTEPVTGPTNPGTTDPGDPGTTDPGDPGTTDPGTTDPGEPGDPAIPGTPVDGTDGAMVTGGLASVVGTPAGAELAQTGGNGGSALLALAVGVAAIAVGLGLRLGRTAHSRR
ncbi:MAG: hypothetical protein DI573_13585 [Microbacterium sp.]|nr:MAG: hypothetical protein DI573_13585 [Microbacterium sp.]